MRIRRFLAASMVGGLLFMTGCELDELLELDSYGYSSTTDDSSYSFWPDDWTWDDSTYDDGGYWSDDILDRKSG